MKPFIRTKLGAALRRSPFIGPILRRQDHRISTLDMELNQLKRQLHQLKMEFKLVGHEYQLYDTYQSALSHCVDTKGYEQDILIRLLIEKQRIALDTNEQPLKVHSSLALSTVAIEKVRSVFPGERLSIIDFGGSTGNHFFQLKKIFGDVNFMKYRIIETEELSKGCSAANFEGPTFYGSLNAATKDLGKLHLLYTSAALPYVPDPYQILRDFIALNPSFIFFNRAAFTEGTKDLIGIQRSRLKDNGTHLPLPEGFQDCEIQYPFTYIQKSRFDKIMSEDYELIMTMEENSGFNMIGHEKISGGAFLYQKRT